MAKITQHRAKEIVDGYRAAETKALQHASAERGYTPSRVLDILDLTLKDWPKKPEPSYIQAVKHVLEKNQGEPFLKTFRELHAVMWLMEKGQPLETAKKKARLLLDELKEPKSAQTQHFFWSWVIPDHKKLLN